MKSKIINHLQNLKKKKEKLDHDMEKFTWVVSLSILKNTPFSETSFVTDSFMAEMAFC